MSESRIEKECYRNSLVFQLVCVAFCVLYFVLKVDLFYVCAAASALSGFSCALSCVRSISGRTAGGKALICEGFDMMITMALNFAMFCCVLPLVGLGAGWLLAAYSVGALACSALIVLRLALLRRS